MKTKNTLRVIATVIALVLSVGGKAQIAQFHIGNGGGGNEHATKVRYLPDGSLIIAGYSYTDTSSQAFIMRVNNSHIIWQNLYDARSGNYNQINDLIITHDTDIVVVGSFGAGGMYTTNRAGIMKINSANGNIIWEKAYYDNTNTEGGEAFWGVNELSANSNPVLNYALVAVGSWNSTPAYVTSLVVVFNASGNYLYNDVCSTSGEEDESFTTVTRPANSASVVIGGTYNPGGTKSVRLLQYTPHATFGSIGWQVWGHFTEIGSNNANLTFNYTNAAYASGNSDTILLTGASTDAYDSAYGATATTPFVISLSAATGAIHYIRQLKNGHPTATWANDCSFAEENPNHIYTSELPFKQYVNTNAYEAGIVANPVLTEVTDLNHMAANVPITLENAFSPTGVYSVLDMKLNSTNSVLAMVGITDYNTFSTGTGSHDIYLATTLTGSDQFYSQGCDTLHDSIPISNISWVVATPTAILDSVVFDTVQIVKSGMQWQFALFCGDTVHFAGRDADPGNELGTVVNSKVDDINIYPNPTTNEVNIVSTGIAINDVQIIDINGKRVGSYSFANAQSANISLSDLAPGTYLLRINNSTSRIVIKTK